MQKYLRAKVTLCAKMSLRVYLTPTLSINSFITLNIKKKLYIDNLYIKNNINLKK